MLTTRTAERRRHYARFSLYQRDILLVHLDGAVVPIPTLRKATTSRDGRRRRSAPWTWRTTYALLQSGQLTPHPTRLGFTIITDEGRRLLAQLLADSAEALVRIGAMDSIPFETINAKCATTIPVSGAERMRRCRKRNSPIKLADGFAPLDNGDRQLVLDYLDSPSLARKRKSAPRVRDRVLEPAK